MKFIYAFTALAATFALATPNPAPEALTLEKKACIPDSCSDWGCCSGDCGYWCDKCGISYSC